MSLKLVGRHQARVEAALIIALASLCGATAFCFWLT